MDLFDSRYSDHPALEFNADGNCLLNMRKHLGMVTMKGATGAGSPEILE